MEGQMESNILSVKEAPISKKSEVSSQDNIIPISTESEVLFNDIPILMEENYVTWKDKTEKWLKNKGLWDYVVGEKREPGNTSSQEYKDWKQKKEEIISIFRRKCGDWTIPYIEELEITLIWSQLVTMYEFSYPTKTEIMRRTNYTWCLPFYKAIVDGNWYTISEMVLKNEGIVTARLTSDGELPLHVAVLNEQFEVAKEFIKIMPVEYLSKMDKSFKTAIHIAAMAGNKEIIKAMVEKDEKLVMLKSRYNEGYYPIIIGTWAGSKEVVNYLYPITIRQEGNQKEDHTGEGEKTKAGILTSLIFADFYGLALDLLHKYPSLVLTRDDSGWTAMKALSMKHTAFPSSLPTKSVGTLGYYFMYSFGSVLDVHIDAKSASWCIRADVENSFNANKDNTQGPNGEPMSGPISNNYPQLLWLCFRRLFQNTLIKLGCKHIYDEKLKHYEACKLLKHIWRLVSQLEVPKQNTMEMSDIFGAFGAMRRATKNGIVEFIEECINNCPQLVLYPENSYNGQTIFHYAISQRQEKIFRLIHHVGPWKLSLAMIRDKWDNDMSHLAAQKAPIQRLNQVPGAALQVQRELLWYKEVKSIMPSFTNGYMNKEKKDSRTLFTEEHKELVKDGATWMKDTSTQCMVVATLITTVMFQAVFTIPSHTSGGDPSDYIQEKFPIVFVITNILALCSSVSSMLMFLAIITSRYAEEDFFLTLPRMLMLGLLFLFISIVGMMIAFVSAILYMFHYDVRVRIFFPIVFVASIPITIYALVELPLFIQLMFSTTFTDAVRKRSKQASAGIQDYH
ncbi:uncharacterized protein LOC122081386 isoform X3 [Macadamia integrifolia]|uniref:uncharacterized protein LOC122081386 isoform X3 n=1 Tax=Macadamia integrifolia TaxID=60698 RepID=UPI001C4E8694|nr:uncharacterized protein LOC122081386 isoform X3 [Macadamia integrifolia]